MTDRNNCVNPRKTRSNRSFVQNRRAVSEVVSSLILVAAVIAAGLAVTGYATSMSTNYQSQYGQSIGSDTNKVKQSLSIEYVSYNAPNLCIYLVNSGRISANITSISVGSQSSTFTMYLMQNGQTTQPLPSHTLNIGQEGRIDSSFTGLIHNGLYTAKIATKEGSIFECNFVA